MVLRCELDKPAPSVEWTRRGVVLRNGDKYQMRKKDLMVEMKIADISLDDTGDYTCICGEERTTASLLVSGECCIHYECIYVEIRSYLMNTQQSFYVLCFIVTVHFMFIL